MDQHKKTTITQRLASASGHLGAVERMARDDASCIDVIRQIQAVQAALTKVSVMLLEAHLDTCILSALHGETIDERQRMLDEVASIFEISKKYHYSLEGEFKENGN